MFPSSGLVSPHNPHCSKWPGWQDPEGSKSFLPAVLQGWRIRRSWRPGRGRWRHTGRSRPRPPQGRRWRHPSTWPQLLCTKLHKPRWCTPILVYNIQRSSYQTLNDATKLSLNKLINLQWRQLFHRPPLRRCYTAYSTWLDHFTFNFGVDNKYLSVLSVAGRQ